MKVLNQQVDPWLVGLFGVFLVAALEKPAKKVSKQDALRFMKLLFLWNFGICFSPILVPLWLAYKTYQIGSFVLEGFDRTIEEYAGKDLNSVWVRKHCKNDILLRVRQGSSL